MAQKSKTPCGERSDDRLMDPSTDVAPSKEETDRRLAAWAAENL
jgi:hypothetical protein